MREKSWEHVFWDTVDGRSQDRNDRVIRNVMVAQVESVQPLAVNVGGLIYEQAQGQVLINEALLKRTDEGVVISAPAPHGSITATVTYPAQLEAGDNVAVVQLEGKQQLIILCKVV